jgi:D-alanyl-D-alanine carboxypeptidase
MRTILNTAFAQIEARPALIASLYRDTPSPRLKPTLVAALAAKNPVPTVAGNEPMRAEIMTAAASFGSGDAIVNDDIGALIALADTRADTLADPDDFNEFERTRLAGFDENNGMIGQGDFETLADFAWSVQIGAYSTKEMAQKELESAVAKTGMEKRERVVLPTPREDGKTLYRARITRLSEIEAASACETLRDKKLSCFVVSDGDAKLN